MTARTQNRTLAWARHDVVTNLTARRVIGVGAFTLATALAAKVAIPVPGTPVPFTLQVLAVLLAGALLGPRLGAAAQLAYVGAGALGAPVFAAGGGLIYLLGPTGGYLMAYPLAAFAVGALAGRSGGFGRLALGLAVGVAVIHAGGTAWLTVVTGSLSRALSLGVGPFLLFDAAKIALVALICLKARPRALELF